MLGKLKYIYDCTCHTTGVQSCKLGGNVYQYDYPVVVFVRGHHINFNKIYIVPMLVTIDWGVNMHEDFFYN